MPGGTMSHPVMRDRHRDLKIVWRVVLGVAVYVVHLLARVQRASRLLLCDPTVFIYVTPHIRLWMMRHLDQDVAI